MKQHPTMTVYIDGKPTVRDVSHREEIDNVSITGAMLVIPREVPKLYEGEQCLHTVNGKVWIVRAKWPEPSGSSDRLMPAHDLDGQFMEDEDGLS